MLARCTLPTPLRKVISIAKPRAQLIVDFRRRRQPDLEMPSIGRRLLRAMHSWILHGTLRLEREDEYFLTRRDPREGGLVDEMNGSLLCLLPHGAGRCS